MEYLKIPLLLLMILSLFSGGCRGSSDIISAELRSYLFQNYTPSMIPICNSSEPVKMSMNLALRQIIDLNEKEQLLLSYVWIRLRWNDCRFSWNSSDYNNITMVTVPYKEAWVPDIALYDSASEGEMMAGMDKYRAQIYNDGTVRYYFPAVLTSTCRVNVLYFPYDTQHCILKFGSWSYNGFSLDIESGSSDMSTYSESSEWIIDEMPAQRNLLYYSCCPEPYPDVTYYINLTRRPEFYVLTWIFPCVLVSLVAALTFILPVESGEKVALGITVLLSLAVFMLIVTDTMPPSSDNFPIMGSYFAVSMVMVSLSCVQNVVVLCIFYRGSDGQKFPLWAKRYIIGYLGNFLRVTRPDDKDREPDLVKVYSNKIHNGLVSREKSVYDDESRSKVSKDNGHINEKGTHQDSRRPAKNMDVQEFTPVAEAMEAQARSLRSICEFLEDKKTEDEANGDWQMISKILDRSFLILYVVISGVVFLAFFLKTIQH